MQEIIICPVCGTEYYDRTGSQETCPSKECRRTNSGNNKKTKHWEGAKKLEQSVQKANDKEYRVTTAIKHAIITDMVRDRGYAYCEMCGPGESGIPLELHHLAYRSEVPNHPKKHSRINTVLLCREHHEWIHAKKSNRDTLVVERRLWLTFPEVFKEKFYE